MTRKIAALLFAAVCSLFSATAQNTFTIQGNVNGLEDGAILDLLSDNGSVLTSVGSDTVHNGRFTFTAKAEDGIAKYALSGRGDRFPSTWAPLWAGPGITVKVTGNGYLIRNWGIDSNIPEQREANRYFEPNRRNWQAWQEITLARQASRGQADRKRERDSLGGAADSVMQQIMLTELAAMKKMQVTDGWMDHLHHAARGVRFGGSDAYRQQVTGLFNGLPEARRKSRVGKIIYTNLYPPAVVKIGDAAADADMTALDGGKRRLAAYRGKYLLLDFWSVGCGPCVMAMPELDSIAGLQPQQLEVVSINIDEKPALWKKFMAGKKATGIHLNDDWGMAGLAAHYGVSGIPHYVMISPEGKVLDRWTGYAKNELAARVMALIR